MSLAGDRLRLARDARACEGPYDVASNDPQRDEVLWLTRLASAVDRWLDPTATTAAKVYAEREVMQLLRTGEPEPSETTRI